MKLDEFWERFQRVEAETAALKFKVLGFQVWPLLRTKIFYQIASQIGLFENPHPHLEKKIEGKPSMLPRAREIVIPFSRKVMGSDPYSDWLSDYLIDPIFVDHEGDGGLDSLKSGFTEKYEDHVARALRRLVSKNKPDIWRNITRGFEAEFGVVIQSYAEYPKWFIRRSIVEALGFRSVFRKTRAKKLYIVNAYSNPTVVLGAKLAGIRVYELQHGFISNLHPAYSYPQGTNVQSLPNVLLCWGEHWKESFSKPNNLKVEVVGANPDFWNYLKRTHEKADRVVITSQGAIGEKLFAIAENFAKFLENFEVIFRLHPNEDPAKYSTNLNNLQISHKEPKFLDLIASAEYLVGGFSTTLFEGAALGCKVIVTDVPGIENVKQAIDSGEFYFLENRDKKSIHDSIDYSKTVRADRYYAQLRPEALNA